MQSSIIPLYKPVGRTPLQMLDLLRKNYPELKKTPLAYAGRLDPMAEGLLLVLSGDECKNSDTHQMLPKEYEVTIIFGFETDTYDPLGIVVKTCNSTISKIDDLKKIINKFTGKYNQEYPPYSSARVNGKPLFYWARAGKLNEISIPSKKIEITEISVIKSKSLSASKLLEVISHKINLVDGDFRQEEILKKWTETLSTSDKEFPTVTLRVKSSHGAYMRSLAHDIGDAIGSCAIALAIKRTSVGNYTLDNVLEF